MQYSLVGNTDDGSSNITVIIDGKILPAHSSHPNFEKIVDAATGKVPVEDIESLFDTGKTVADKFQRLTERVTVVKGHLLFDGDPVDPTLAEPVVRFLNEDVDDWKPLVNFLENVQGNPEPHSREQLYNWLKDRPFPITPDGMFVAYKGVVSEKGEYFSVSHGTATVDGVVHTGAIPNKVGSVVEMPRSEVEHDPGAACHVGLHVGTYDFAKRWAHGALLEVHVNPRDVVSVPTDCDAAKMRVCRYRVVGVTEVEYTAPVVRDYSDFESCDCEGECDDSCVDDVPLDRLDENDLVDANLDNAPYVPDPQPEPQSDAPAPAKGVEVGDRFEDLDQRRHRVIVVTKVSGDTVEYEVEGTGTKHKINANRLLTRYRFKRV